MRETRERDTRESLERDQRASRERLERNHRDGAMADGLTQTNKRDIESQRKSERRYRDIQATWMTNKQTDRRTYRVIP